VLRSQNTASAYEPVWQHASSPQQCPAEFGQDFAQLRDHRSLTTIAQERTHSLVMVQVNEPVPTAVPVIVHNELACTRVNRSVAQSWQNVVGYASMQYLAQPQPVVCTVATGATDGMSHQATTVAAGC
jgi:hypothetical protein